MCVYLNGSLKFLILLLFKSVSRNSLFFFECFFCLVVRLFGGFLLIVSGSNGISFVNVWVVFL